METKEFESRATPGKKTGVLAIVEGVRFWAREDAVNEERNLIDPAVSFLLGSLLYCETWEACLLVLRSTLTFSRSIDPQTHEQTRRYHIRPHGGRRGNPTARVV